MAFNFLALMPFAEKIIGLIPDPAARAQLRLDIMKEENRAGLEGGAQQLSAIIAEAKSDDKWTSRARPAFLYVVYLYIVSAIPMGFLYAFDPDAATNVTTGVGMWLKVLPESIVTLFGVGYLGYTGARSWDKVTKAKRK